MVKKILKIVEYTTHMRCHCHLVLQTSPARLLLSNFASTDGSWRTHPLTALSPRVKFVSSTGIGSEHFMLSVQTMRLKRIEIGTIREKYKHNDAPPMLGRVQSAPAGTAVSLHSVKAS